MKITRVEGEDFLTLGHVEFDLADQGLVLVQGENRDDTAAMSNGSGKSSLVDLVCWVIWGTTARGSTGDAVIRDGTKSTKGEICIEDTTENCSWLITRERKKGKSKLSLTCVDHPTASVMDLTLGTEKLTQEKIAGILGTTEDVFRASIYMGQEQLVDLPMMTDRQLKLVVEEAAGVLTLEKAYEKARELLSEKKSLVDTAQHELELFKTTLAHKNDMAKEYDKLSLEWLTEKSDMRDNLHEKLEVLTREYSELETKIQLPLVASLEASLRTVRVKLSALATDRRRETELRAALSKAKTEFNMIELEIDRLNKRIVMAQANLENVGRKIGTPCGECGSIITADHLHDASASIEIRIAACETEKSIQGAKLAEAKGVAQEATDALSAFLESISDPDELLREQKTYEDRLKMETGKIDNMERMKLKITLIKNDIAEIRKATNPFMSKLVANEREITALTPMLRGKEFAVDQAKIAVNDTEKAVQVFSPSGVRAHILDTVTPYLNARTSEYLTLLSDGVIHANWTTLVRNAKGEMKEKFSIEVTHSSGIRGFAELSGGEKRKVRLACVLALQDLVASRANKPFQLFVADEIDHALDEAGLERLTTVLQTKVKTTGTVIVISHNALDSYIPTVWRVIKEGGKSSLIQ